MYFLNGERIYIKPEKACDTIEEQMENCFAQLVKINHGKKIFKLNFFIDAASAQRYNELKSEIDDKVNRFFSNEIIHSLIAQPPLTCKIIVEAFFYSKEEWQAELVKSEQGRAVLFTKDNTQLLIGTSQSQEFSDCRENSEKAFAQLREIFERVNFGVNTIVRQWNYIENILGIDEGKQKYQEFNDIRSEFYAKHFEKNGYPAATGIGTKTGGIIIEFVAVKSDMAISKAIDNPGQIAAHHYSDDVLIGEECVIKTTPKFERARYFQLFDKKMIFISGTASIIGENTVGVNDAAKQTEITIQNIKNLYSENILKKLSRNKLTAKYGHARVYVKKRKDFAAIKRTVKKHYGNLPVVYIIADVCRNDLLVEIEGKVVLE